MNIKDFLIDNYIYILVVILLIIITIIGFLADKKKNKEKKVIHNDGNMQSINYQANLQQIMEENSMNNMRMNVQPINLVQVPNGMANSNQFNQNLNQFDNLQNNNISQSVPIQMMQSVNNNFGDSSVNNNNLNTYVAPVENINQVSMVQPEPMYQPIGEQSQAFNSIEPIQKVNNQVPIEVVQGNGVQSFSTQMVSNVNGNVANPIMENNNFNSPTVLVDNNHTSMINPEPIYQSLSEQKPTFNAVEPMRNINNQNPIELSQVNDLNNSMLNSGQMGMPNSIQDNSAMNVVMPVSVNQMGYNIPNMGMTPSPSVAMNQVSGVEIISNNGTNISGYSDANNYAMTQPMTMPNLVQSEQVMKPMESVGTIPNPVMTGPAPINFVYGPQQNNNQNMQ